MKVLILEVDDKTLGNSNIFIYEKNAKLSMILNLKKINKISIIITDRNLISNRGIEMGIKSRSFLYHGEKIEFKILDLSLV